MRPELLSSVSSDCTQSAGWIPLLLCYCQLLAVADWLHFMHIDRSKKIKYSHSTVIKYHQ